MLARLGIVAGSARYEGIGDTTLEALHKRGLVSREPIEGRRLSERWAITDAGREVAAKALSGATVTARLSLTQRDMLRKVAKGYAHWRDADDTRPYQISNTNRTAGALESRGLIAMAEDQSEARKTLCFAWVVTDDGRKALEAMV